MQCIKRWAAQPIQQTANNDEGTIMLRTTLTALSILALTACGGSGSGDAGPRLIEGPLTEARLVCSPASGPATQARDLTGTVYGKYLLLDGTLTQERAVSADQIAFHSEGIAVDRNLSIENNTTAVAAVVADGVGDIIATVSVYDNSTNTTEEKMFGCDGGPRNLLYAGLDFIRIGAPSGSSVGNQDQSSVINTAVPFAVGGFVRGNNNQPRAVAFPAGCGYETSIENNGGCHVSGQTGQSAVLSNSNRRVSFECTQPGSYAITVSDIVLDTVANPAVTRNSCEPQILGANNNIATNQGLLNISKDTIEDIRRFPPVCTLRVDGTTPSEGSVAPASACPPDRSNPEPAVLLGNQHAFTAVVKNPDTNTHYYVAELIDENEAVRAWGFSLFDGADETTATNLNSSSECTGFTVGYDAAAGTQVLTAPTFSGDLSKCDGEFIQTFLANDEAEPAPLVAANAPAQILQAQIDDVRLDVTGDPVINGAVTGVVAMCHFVGADNYEPCENNADYLVADWSASSCDQGSFSQLPTGLDSSFVTDLSGFDAANCTLRLTLSDANGDTSTSAAVEGGSFTASESFDVINAPVATFKLEPELSCVGRSDLLQSLSTASRVRGQAPLFLTDVVRQIPGCVGDSCAATQVPLDADNLNWTDSDNVQPGYWNGNTCTNSVDDTGAVGDLTDLLNEQTSGGIGIVQPCEDDTAAQCYGANSQLRLQSYCVTATLPANAANGQEEVIAGTTIIVLPVINDELLQSTEELCETLDPALGADAVGDPGAGPEVVNLLGNVLDPVLANLDTAGGTVPEGAISEVVDLLLYGDEDTFPFGISTITAQLLGEGTDPVPGLNLLSVVEVLGGCAVSPILDVVGIPLDFLLDSGIDGIGDFVPPNFDNCTEAGEGLVGSFQDALGL